MASESIFGDSNEVEDQFSTDELLRYAQVIRKKKWLILTATILASLLSTVLALRMPDFYSAETRILVHDTSNAHTTVHQEAGTPQTQSNAYKNTQAEILKGLNLSKQVVEDLGLQSYYNMNSSIEAANMLNRRTEIELVPRTNVIVVQVDDLDPIMAATLANYLAKAYIKQSFKDQLFVSEQILEWFPDEIDLDEDPNPTEMLKRFDNEEAIMTLPSVVNDPSVKQLKGQQIELEAERRDLMTRYTEAHPKVKELNSRLAFVKSEILMAARRIAASVRASLSGKFNVSNIKILQEAEPPLKPSSRAKPLIPLVGTGFGFCFGIVLVLIMNTFDKTIKTDEDAILTTALPLLGQVPILTSQKQKKKRKIDERFTAGDFLNDPLIVDAFTTMNTALIFSMPKGLNKRIMVTSSTQGEGKSTTAYLLAVSMAKLGEKVLVVELDLRKPSFKKLLNVKDTHQQGITDLLVGQATLEAVTLPSPDNPNLDIILAGKESPNPSVLFTSNAFGEFFDNVDKRYDRIIVDTPPSFNVPDPVIISGRMHGSIFVIGAGKTHRKVVQKTIHKLNFSKSVMFGVVLNRVSFDDHDQYMKYGYYHYSAKDDAKS